MVEMVKFFSFEVYVFLRLTLVKFLVDWKVSEVEADSGQDLILN